MTREIRAEAGVNHDGSIDKSPDQALAQIGICYLGPDRHAPGNTLSGGCVIEAGVHISAGAVVIQGWHISTMSVVKADSAVVLAGSTVIGHPARVAMKVGL